MNEVIPIDLSTAGHLLYPPIVDFLAYEPALGAFVVEFVPEAVVSSERKESVYIYDQDAMGAARRTRELLLMLSQACGAPGEIVKLAHGGRGNFSFYSADNQLIELHDSPSSQATMEVYAILQALSVEVQLEFIRQLRVKQRKAL